MDTFREHLLADMAANPEKGLNKFFYRAREAADPEQLEMFFEVLRQSEEARENG